MNKVEHWVEQMENWKVNFLVDALADNSGK
jgi:hypothetical protein